MSWEATTAVVKGSYQKGGSLLVMMMLANYANEEGIAWPSVPTLARDCRMSERAVQYCLRSGVDKGELEVLVAAGPRGCNMYRIRLLGPQSELALDGIKPVKFSPRKPPDRGEKIAPVQTLQGEKSGEEGCKIEHQGVKPASPDPLLDQSEIRKAQEQNGSHEPIQEKTSDGINSVLRKPGERLPWLERFNRDIAETEAEYAADPNARDRNCAMLRDLARRIGRGKNSEEAQIEQDGGINSVLTEA